MSGRAPKQKGDRAERAVVKLLQDAGIDAKRVPLSGSAKGYPGDVCAVVRDRTDPLGGTRELCLEVKARADFKTLYGWLEHRDGLILKGDRREALVVLRLKDLFDFVEETETVNQPDTGPEAREYASPREERSGGMNTNPLRRSRRR